MANVAITNPTSLDALIAAATRYKAALVAKTIAEADEHALFNSAFDVFGTQELYDLSRDTAPPEADLWGNAIGSLAERRASYGFDLAKDAA